MKLVRNTMAWLIRLERRLDNMTESEVNARIAEIQRVGDDIIRKLCIVGFTVFFAGLFMASIIELFAR